MKKKVIYFHGLGGAKEQSRIYETIKEYFNDEIILLAPEVPHNPLDAKKWIKEYIENEKPNLIVSSSMGSFYTLQNNAFIPTIVINPAMMAYSNLLECFGIGYKGEFKPGRSDGKTNYILDEKYFNELKIVEDEYKKVLSSDDINKEIYGVFSINDELFSNISNYIKYYNGPYIKIDDIHHISIDSILKFVIPVIKRIL